MENVHFYFPLFEHFYIDIYTVYIFQTGIAIICREYISKSQLPVFLSHFSYKILSYPLKVSLYLVLIVNSFHTAPKYPVHNFYLGGDTLYPANSNLWLLAHSNVQGAQLWLLHKPCDVWQESPHTDYHCLPVYHKTKFLSLTTILTHRGSVKFKNVSGVKK